MGIEYRIEFTDSDPNATDEILRSAPFFVETERQIGDRKYEYRLPENVGLMPNAQAAIESYGVYFCDFGGARDIMTTIVQQLGDRIGSLHVAEIE